MNRIYRETRTVRIQHFKWEGNQRVTLSPDTYHEIQLEVDIDTLFSDIGEKAARSKSGKSVEAGGAITARRVKK